MKRRGTTLAEVLVASTLLGLVFLLVAQVMRPGWRAWVRGTCKSEVQQNCLVTITRLTEELRGAYPDSVHVMKDRWTDDQGQEHHRDALVFLTLLDGDGHPHLAPEGDPLWQRWVYFYHDGVNRQIRWHDYPLPTPRPNPDLDAIPTLVKSDTDRIVARHMSSFELDDSTLPTLGIAVEAEYEGFSSRHRTSILPNLSTLAPPATSPSGSPHP